MKAIRRLHSIGINRNLCAFPEWRRRINKFRQVPSSRTVSSSPILSSSKSHSPPQLMHGMKVVELASVLAGPTVCQFFAELGKGHKVENTTTKGDVTRTWKLSSEFRFNSHLIFSCCNVGRKVSSKLERPKRFRTIHEIVKDADVVIASYKPGDAEKLQVDYNTLSTITQTDLCPNNRLWLGRQSRWL